MNVSAIGAASRQMETDGIVFVGMPEECPKVPPADVPPNTTSEPGNY